MLGQKGAQKSPLHEISTNWQAPRRRYQQHNSKVGQADNHGHHDEHEGDQETREEAPLVTCGSLVKLKHVQTGTRLHSHKVTYGSGSGQQSVTATSDKDDPNSFWKVRGPHGTHCLQGEILKQLHPRTPINNGDIIRLQHHATNLNLHSHLHQSPLSRQQEVSCFREEGDTGDNWKLVLPMEDWRRGDTVRFEHVDTGLYLNSHNKKYGNPIPGQLEVTCVPKNKMKKVNTEWTAEEGMYFPPRDD